MRNFQRSLFLGSRASSDIIPIGSEMCLIISEPYNKMLWTDEDIENHGYKSTKLVAVRCIQLKGISIDFITRSHCA